jgi:hypothetical protein
MLHNFLLCISFTFILFISFGKDSSESLIRDQQYIHSLRQERIDARVCEDEKGEDGDEEWDLCYKSNFVTTTFEPKHYNLPFAQKINSKSIEKHCSCDNECDAFKECCSDFKPNIERPTIKSQLSCIDLYSGSFAVASVYGIDKCSEVWGKSDGFAGVRDKCENDSYDLTLNEKSISYLRDIAVFSLSTNVMYRNVFCAICNNDSSNLMQWNTSVQCEGVHDLVNNQRNSISTGNYDSFKKNWNVIIKGVSIDCSIVVEEFGNPDLIDKYKLRKCKKTISNCPKSWNDSIVAEKCESYASYVYETKAYKNYHCALCNNALIKYLTCFPMYINLRSDSSHNALWFPLLLDFNFAGDKGEWIGGHKKCSNIGEIYDPIYEKCVFIHCGTNYRKDHETGLCLPIENLSNNFPKNNFESNCRSIIVLTQETDFTLFENNSIYINKTNTILNEYDYRIHYEDDQSVNTSLKIKICINESSLDSWTQSPFDVSFGQILLTGISLYTSIVCLIIHLLVYAILPKLRNLPGKNLVSLSSSLLIAHISFVTLSHLEANRRIGCVLNAITIHYSYLASFCWMSVMAYDVCKTFGRTSRRSTSSKRSTFVKYSLYAWLLPAFIVIICAAFDIGLQNSHFRPLYGFRICFISQRQALLVFFAIPVALIICVNIFLFSLTAKGLITTAEKTKILNKNSDKVRYYLYVKLAFVMGLTWIFGFIASLTDITILWYPFIILNGLQGAIIFFAFTFKPKVWNLLMDKFGCIRPSKSATTSDIIRSATGSTTLQTSTLVPNSPDTKVTKIKFPD